MSDGPPDDGPAVEPGATPPAPDALPPYPGSPLPAYPSGPPTAYPPGYPPPGYPPPGGTYPGGSYPGIDPMFGSPYASWGYRLGGWLIDFVLIAIVSRVLAAPFTKNVKITGTRHFHLFANGGGWALLIQTVIVLVYGMLMIGSSRGQTVGMMAVGIRCVGGEHEERVSYGRALGRAAFESLLAALLLVPWIIDMLWPLWDSRSQTLHDKVVGTVVLRRGATLGLAPPAPGQVNG